MTFAEVKRIPFFDIREGCNCCMDDMFLDENLECMALYCRGTQIDEETMALSSSCV